MFRNVRSRNSRHRSKHPPNSRNRHPTRRQAVRIYHKLKTADQHLQNLFNNVALASTVLRLLCDNLRKDDQGKLYSTEAFSTTQRALNECKNVFTQIGNSIDQNQNSAGSGKTRMRMQRAAKRVSFVLTREQELELLATNLERLKSTLHLMLNVIMYAGQLRRLVFSRFLLVG